MMIRLLELSDFTETRLQTLQENIDDYASGSTSLGDLPNGLRHLALLLVAENLHVLSSYVNYDHMWIDTKRYIRLHIVVTTTDYLELNVNVIVRSISDMKDMLLNLDRYYTLLNNM